MNIGKLSFSEIIRIGFERRNALFAAGWLFLISVVTTAFSLLSAALRANGIRLWANVIDGLALLVIIVLGLILTLGLYSLVKTSIARTKKANTAARVKGLFWKTLGAFILWLLGAAVAGLAAYWLGFLVRLPYVGDPLMALLFIPAAVFFGLLSIYILVGSKLLPAVLVDKPALSALGAVKKVFTITVRAPEKISFNFVLGLLPILSTLLTLALLAGACAIVPYLSFGWAFPHYPLLQYASQLGLSGLIFYATNYALSYLSCASILTIILTTLGFFGIVSYALGYVISVSTAVYYSIYLDAK
ncbi:MAG: hypothetical protein LBQ83_06370 [Candidatus Margulisbacteria bacterium]|jgi:hypothetical protein|nr:hypothetical protein [Candidatus Margulisiibacteriota bacterium]